MSLPPAGRPAPRPLPPPPRPVGSYVPVVRDGGLAWVSGQIAIRDGATVHPGLVDAEVDVPRAQEAARQATLQALSALSEAMGGLDHVRRVIRLSVFVASSTGFARQHEVANGASDVLVEYLGEAGRPSRVAVGVSRLPLNACVEVDLLAAVRE